MLTRRAVKAAKCTPLSSTHCALCTARAPLVCTCTVHVLQADVATASDGLCGLSMSAMHAHRRSCAALGAHLAACAPSPRHSRHTSTAALPYGCIHSAEPTCARLYVTRCAGRTRQAGSGICTAYKRIRYHVILTNDESTNRCRHLRTAPSPPGPECREARPARRRPPRDEKGHGKRPDQGRCRASLSLYSDASMS